MPQDPAVLANARLLHLQEAIPPPVLAQSPQPEEPGIVNFFERLKEGEWEAMVS